MGGSFRPHAPWIHRLLSPIDDESVDSILDEFVPGSVRRKGGPNSFRFR